jgi:hypothetical protein
MPRRSLFRIEARRTVDAPRTLAGVSDVSSLPLIGAAALRARAAARVLRTLPTDVKDAALAAMADALVERSDEVLAANAADIEAAAAEGNPDSSSWRCRTPSVTWFGAPGCPTDSSCGRSGCRWGWSASSTRRVRT